MRGCTLLAALLLLGAPARGEPPASQRPTSQGPTSQGATSQGPTSQGATSQGPTSQGPTSAPVEAAGGPVVFGERTVLAKEKPRIVLLSMSRFPEQAWTAVERHAAAELRASGLSVVHAPTAAGDLEARVAELSAQAVRHRAIGAVRVIRRGRRPTIQVWVYDAITNKTLHREATAPGAAPDKGLDLAKQVVELLNASLIEIRMRRRRPITGVPKLVRRIVAKQLPAPPPRPGRFSVTLAPGVTYAGKLTGAALLLGGDARLWRWIGFGLQTRLPLMSQRLAAGGEEAEITTFAARGLLALEPWRARRWSPSLSVGLGALVLRAAGGADEMVDWTATLELVVRAALAWRLSRAPALQLEASLGVGVPLPEPTVAFAADARSGLGRAALEGALGIRWSP